METGFRVGNDMHKDGVGAVADALMQMLQSGAEQETIRAAIRAFSTLSEVKNVNVSHANIIGGNVGMDEKSVSEYIQKAVKGSAWSRSEDNCD